jgi:hypothetical protein
MKPIKHMRSKRGFYIGRLSQQMANQANHSKIHLNWLELQEEGWHFQVF